MLQRAQAQRSFLQLFLSKVLGWKKSKVGLPSARAKLIVFADPDSITCLDSGFPIRRQSHLLLHGLANRTPRPTAAGVLREAVVISP
jgi:hypothetical protein